MRQGLLAAKSVPHHASLAQLEGIESTQDICCEEQTGKRCGVRRKCMLATFKVIYHMNCHIPTKYVDSEWEREPMSAP